MDKVNAVWVPLRKRLLELSGNKEGFLAVLGTDQLFEVQPDGLEYPKMMEALQAKEGVEEFRRILKDLAERGDLDRCHLAVMSIPKVEP
jgi:hypothetical protein